MEGFEVTFKQNLKWVIGSQWDRYMDRGFKMDNHSYEILQMLIDRWLEIVNPKENT